MKRIKPITEEEKERVFNTIEDYILDTYKLCSLRKIMKLTNLHRKRCKDILEKLVKEKRLVIVYEGSGEPKIYMPSYMFEEVLRTQRKPEWIKKYIFSDKNTLIEKLKQIRKSLSQYETIERLLYGTGEPLEESVEYALKYLGFSNVFRPEEKDTYDISFEYKGKKYILEIEGTTKQGSKDKVNQLDGWIKKEIENGSNPDELIGIFVVNHFRNKDPEERGDPLTEQAKKFLKYHHFRFFTTVFLFKIIKKVTENSLNLEIAREKIIKGEKYF